MLSAVCCLLSAVCCLLSDQHLELECRAIQTIRNMFFHPSIPPHLAFLPI
jgi:hypothetical protein